MPKFRFSYAEIQKHRGEREMRVMGKSIEGSRLFGTVLDGLYCHPEACETVRSANSESALLSGFDVEKADSDLDSDADSERLRYSYCFRRGPTAFFPDKQAWGCISEKMHVYEVLAV
jgi:hypothetical protein